MYEMTIKTIIAHNISSIRSNNVLFDNITFTVQNGSIFQIHGSNGAGKTTLLKILLGIIVPSKGYITINNSHISYNELKNFTAYLDSTPVFKENLTVIDYLIYWITMRNSLKNTSYQHIENAIVRFGLYSYRNTEIYKLSLGQKKRLLLSKLILLNRQLWLLDEPFIGLDKYWTLELKNMIYDHQKQGGIIVLTTHTNADIKQTYNLILY